MKPIFFKSFVMFFFLFPSLSNFAQNTDSIQLSESMDLYFDFAQHHLRAESTPLLDQIVELRREKTIHHINITAHTDAIGSNKSNWELARKRGESVKNYLLEAEVPVELLQITPFGEEQPIAENDTENNRQLNRRVSIQVFETKEITKITSPTTLSDDIPTTTVSGQVKDKETGEGLEADIIIHGKMLRDSFHTDKNGFFSRAVPENKVIGIDIYANGHFYDTQMLKTKKGKMPALSFDLTAIKAGASIDIKNLYFVGDQPVLLTRSLSERPKILRFMQLNDTTRIEIAGHVNHPGVHPSLLPRKSYLLSVNRARNIYDYLISNGIPASRMTFKGYGNSQMRFPRPRTLKEQELNRRVEIKILGRAEVISEADPLKIK